MSFGMYTISNSENCRNCKQEEACNIGIVNINRNCACMVCTLRLYTLMKSVGFHEVKVVCKRNKKIDGNKKEIIKAQKDILKGKNGGWQKLIWLEKSLSEYLQIEKNT